MPRSGIGQGVEVQFVQHEPQCTLSSRLPQLLRQDWEQSVPDPTVLARIAHFRTWYVVRIDPQTLNHRLSQGICGSRDFGCLYADHDVVLRWKKVREDAIAEGASGAPTAAHRYYSHTATTRIIDIALEQVAPDDRGAVRKRRQRNEASYRAEIPAVLDDGRGWDCSVHQPLRSLNSRLMDCYGSEAVVKNGAPRASSQGVRGMGQTGLRVGRPEFHPVARRPTHRTPIRMLKNEDPAELTQSWHPIRFQAIISQAVSNGLRQPDHCVVERFVVSGRARVLYGRGRKVTGIFIRVRRAARDQPVAIEHLTPSDFRRIPNTAKFDFNKFRAVGERPTVGIEETTNDVPRSHHRLRPYQEACSGRVTAAR